MDHTQEAEYQSSRSAANDQELYSGTLLGLTSVGIRKIYGNPENVRRLTKSEKHIAANHNEADIASGDGIGCAMRCLIRGQKDAIGLSSTCKDMDTLYELISKAIVKCSDEISDWTHGLRATNNPEEGKEFSGNTDSLNIYVRMDPQNMYEINTGNGFVPGTGRIMKLVDDVVKEYVSDSMMVMLDRVGEGKFMIRTGYPLGYERCLTPTGRTFDVDRLLKSMPEIKNDALREAMLFVGTALGNEDRTGQRVLEDMEVSMRHDYEHDDDHIKVFDRASGYSAFIDIISDNRLNHLFKNSLNNEERTASYHPFRVVFKGKEGKISYKDAKTMNQMAYPKIKAYENGAGPAPERWEIAISRIFSVTEKIKNMCELFKSVKDVELALAETKRTFLKAGIDFSEPEKRAADSLEGMREYVSDLGTDMFKHIKLKVPARILTGLRSARDDAIRMAGDNADLRKVVSTLSNQCSLLDREYTKEDPYKPISTLLKTADDNYRDSQMNIEINKKNISHPTIR